ncbi:hypothetical protein DPMN_045658 [Dreissena polymorpha]|uniref:Uncharacterized protein n=1 Tax=Dreissena polymorpha TaxID=45954 RepID=A0A9D4HZU4_DREPO|nr:hypothetical protein DPMN_045658 [Dreissena polymorpha]
MTERQRERTDRHTDRRQRRQTDRSEQDRTDRDRDREEKETTKRQRDRDRGDFRSSYEVLSGWYIAGISNFGNKYITINKR